MILGERRVQRSKRGATASHTRSELLHVCLADEETAYFNAILVYGSGRSRSESKRRTGGGGRDSRDVDRIFDREWHAIKWRTMLGVRKAG